jgi:hypothetical protein
MASSGMLRRVALVRTDVSEELSASFIRVTRIGELGTTVAVTSITRATQHNIPEDTILHSHRHENLKSYKCVSLMTTKHPRMGIHSALKILCMCYMHTRDNTQCRA